MSAQAEERSTGTFFHHGFVPPPRPPRDLTRYLCAATYLDSRLCDLVIDEYVYARHRAVVPSYGFDLAPVILHARRARALRLARDGLMTLLLAMLCVLSPLAVLAGLLVLGYASLLIRRRGTLTGYVLGIPVVIMGLVGLGFFMVAGFLLTTIGGFLSTGGAGMLPGSSLFTVVFLLLTLPFVLAIFVTGFGAVGVIGHLLAVFRILRRDLAPGASGPGPDPGDGRFREAVEHVRVAQNGNVTLFAGDNPFLGAGHPEGPGGRTWSIVLELDRKASGDGDGSRKDGRTGDGTRSGPPVDPVVMHQRVRERLAEMRGDGGGRDRGRPLPPNERVTGLAIDWHVVAPGRCVQHPRPVSAAGGALYPGGHPLIDPRSGRPYSRAVPEAIEALVRHPQAGIRCFQRVTIDMQGQAVGTRDGRLVAPEEDQEIGLSAFLYLAVEGRMLYGQLTVTVLPPVRLAYRVVDEIAGWSGAGLFARAVRTGLPYVLSTPLTAPRRFSATVWRMARSAMASDFAPDSARAYVHDYGARISVRELAADGDVHTLLQAYDVEKYTRMVEQRVNEALLDYLEDECGVDVSAYRAQGGMILNQGVIMTGGSVSGQMAVGGQGARITQTRRTGGGAGITP